MDRARTIFKQKEIALEEDKLINLALIECLNDIWDHYDDDRNGVLEYVEAKKFLKDVLKECGIDNVRSADIKKAFEEFDEDKSNSISKDEMMVFVRLITGI